MPAYRLLKCILIHIFIINRIKLCNWVIKMVEEFEIHDSNSIRALDFISIFYRSRTGIESIPATFKLMIRKQSDKIAVQSVYHECLSSTYLQLIDIQHLADKYKIQIRLAKYDEDIKGVIFTMLERTNASALCETIRIDVKQYCNEKAINFEQSLVDYCSIDHGFQSMNASILTDRYANILGCVESSTARHLILIEIIKICPIPIDNALESIIQAVLDNYLF